MNKVYIKLKILLSGSLSAFANPSDQFWVSPAIGLVLARGSVTPARSIVVISTNYFQTEYLENEFIEHQSKSIKVMKNGFCLKTNSCVGSLHQ